MDDFCNRAPLLLTVTQRVTMDQHTRTRPPTAGRSTNQDWLRALQRTAAIDQNPASILPIAFDEIAQARGDAPAILSANENFTFRELSERARRYANWGLGQGFAKGDAVALMMDNRPEYVAIWLGLTRIGVVVALINVNLDGAALAHCIDAARPRLILVTQNYAARCASAAPTYRCTLVDDAFSQALSQQTATPPALEPDSQPTIFDHALYIYTSGTTGLPKASIVTHRRIMNWALWFGGLADVTTEDRMYDCLPLYHSVGGIVAVFTPLLAGGSVFLRERFSANAFWKDVVANECTMFQYIGELCRYLVHAPPCADEKRHRLRLALGNGLRPEVWDKFVDRFALPRVLEFYAATESNFALYNVEGETGAVGRVPSFLAAHQTLVLIRYDADADAPMRADDGFCIACKVDEPGEAIAKIAGGDFDGYLDRAASEKKILRNVFEAGDAFMRSGDLMRRDARGFYFFVDRVGDTFRWKGENVATAEVAQALACFPGVIDVSVYGVAVPNRDGRAGMAALVVDDTFELAALRAYLDARLPAYAQPLFLRAAHAISITDTFKHRKAALAAEGFDPKAIDAPLYFAPPRQTIYLALDSTLYARILAGAVDL